MSNPQFIVTRAQFDSLMIRLMQLDFGCPAEMAPAANEFAYPLATATAIDEARKRGVAANQYQADRFIARHPDMVPICGRTRLWSKAAIDLLVVELTAAGLFTAQAIQRRDLNKTAQDEVDRIAAELDRQIAEAKKFIADAHRTAENCRAQKEAYASN